MIHDITNLPKTLGYIGGPAKRCSKSNTGFVLKGKKPADLPVEMPLNERNDPEMSYRRGYQDGAFDMLRAVERFLDPAIRKVVHAWIEQDINGWRLKLAHPPTWRLTELNALKSK